MLFGLHIHATFPAHFVMGHYLCAVLVAVVARRSHALDPHTNTRMQVVALSGDITAADAASRVANALQAEFGRVDVLVNNAGVCYVCVCVLCKGDDADTQGRVGGIHTDVSVSLCVVCSVHSHSDCSLNTIKTTSPPLYSAVVVNMSLSHLTGYTWDGVIHRMSDKQWDAMLDVHVSGGQGGTATHGQVQQHWRQQ